MIYIYNSKIVRTQKIILFQIVILLKLQNIDATDI